MRPGALLVLQVRSASLPMPFPSCPHNSQDSLAMPPPPPPPMHSPLQFTLVKVKVCTPPPSHVPPCRDKHGNHPTTAQIHWIRGLQIGVKT